MYMDNIKLSAKDEKKNWKTEYWIYSQDIGMEFHLEKCAMLIMRSGKRQKIEGIDLRNQEKIRTLREGNL